MTAFALWASLFFVSASAQAPAKPPMQSPTPAPTQVVSLVDLLVEGQTLYTMAVDKQPESLTAALDLARQAQRAVADETVKKRLPAGAHPDEHDLTVLGALRARISTLASAIEKRRDYFKGQYEDIQNLVQRKHFDEARSALDRLPADAPTADPICPFADLRDEIQRAMPIYRAQPLGTASGNPAASGPPASSSPTSNRRLLATGIVVTAVLATTGAAVHSSMNQKYDQMSFLPAGSYQWWALHDEADQQRRVRNGLYAAAIGVGTAFAIVAAVKANSSPSRALAPFGPHTFVGFSPDPHRPAIMVVKIF
jgi:hypothetical protein